MAPTSVTQTTAIAPNLTLLTATTIRAYFTAFENEYNTKALDQVIPTSLWDTSVPTWLPKLHLSLAANNQHDVIESLVAALKQVKGLERDHDVMKKDRDYWAMRVEEAGEKLKEAKSAQIKYENRWKMARKESNIVKIAAEKAGIDLSKIDIHPPKKTTAANITAKAKPTDTTKTKTKTAATNKVADGMADKRKADEMGTEDEQEDLAPKRKEIKSAAAIALATAAGALRKGE